MSTIAPSRQDLTASALAALTGERWAITDAAQHVLRAPACTPSTVTSRPGEISKLEPAPDAPFYVGKAEESLVSRDLNGHFATNPKSTPRTGGSNRAPVFRSAAARGTRSARGRLVVPDEAARHL